MSNTSKVFFSVTMSVDGFTAPESRYDDVNDARWFAQWGELQKYIHDQKAFRELIGETGGLTGDDNRILESTFKRTGVTIMGKRMFDLGERFWQEDDPYHSPVFVLTHQKRDPWSPKKGGTTFHFVNDGIESALRRAREVAPPGKDIRVGGGAHTIREYLEAGLVEEAHIALSPMIMGRGTPLLAGIDATKFTLEVQPPTASPMVTHLRYKVTRR